MASLRSRGHPSRGTALLFLSVGAVAVAALVWMGLRLVKQDRALEAQQLEERREAADDRMIVALEQVLLAEERKLGDLLGAESLPSTNDVVWINHSGDTYLNSRG